MRDFGIVRPGTTLYIPFATYDSNDPSASVTLTGLATTDIEVYRDGSTTQRSSDAGFALLDTDGIDFDGVTGIHGISINLADNSDAGFYRSGSQYTVVVASITVDAATINFIAATFRIGISAAVLNTSIATLASQTSFTLTDGPAEDDALNGFYAIIHDVASAVQFAKVLISDYTGSTKTVTLAAGATFTVAASDNFSVMDLAPLQPTTVGRTLDVSTDGEAGIDWANVGSPTTTLALTGTTIATTQKVDVETIKTQTLTAAAGITFGVYVGGTAAAAVASTALSTATWTGTLATNIGMTNTTVATNLDAVLSVRTLAAADYFDPAADKVYLGDGAHGGTAATITFERMIGASTTTNQSAVKLTGNGNGGGLELMSGATNGCGLKINNTSGGFGIYVSTTGLQAMSIGSSHVGGSAMYMYGSGSEVVLIENIGVGKSIYTIGPVNMADASNDIRGVTLNATTGLGNQTANITGTVSGNSTHDAAAVLTALGNGSWATEAGGTGDHLTAVPWNATWDAEVQSEVADGLAVFWTSPATLVDLIWDEPTSGHATAGTTGKALTDAGAAGDPWGTTVPGAYGAGTAGYILGTNLDAVLTARTLAAASYFDPAADTVASVISVGSVTGGINTGAGTITTLDGLDTSIQTVLGTPTDTDLATDIANVQTSVDNITIGSAGIAKTADSATITTGSQTNTYTATTSLDGTLHSITPATGNTEFYYEWNLGEDGVPISVDWSGYANTAGDSYAVYFYNWGGTSWDQVGTITAAPGTTVGTAVTYSATVAHVGTGANAGIVRWRVVSTTGTNFSTDRLVCNYTVLGGGIPNGTTITLAASRTNENFIGRSWNLALGGQDISGSYFYQAISVTGTGTVTNGSPFVFQECNLVTPTLSAYGFIENSVISDTLTLTSTAGVSADSVNIINSKSGVAGSGAPTITAAAVTKNTNIQARNWFGGCIGVMTSDCVWSHEVVSGGTQNFTNAGGSLELRGAPKAVVLTTSGAATSNVIVWSGCPITINGTAGTVNIWGLHGGVTDNSTGTTITDNGTDVTRLDAAITDRTLAAASYFDPATDTVANVTTVATTTNLTSLPTIPTNWLTADGLATDAINEIQSGLSTLTQTQVTGGAYALNSASFAFNAGLDFTTTQKAATIARVTLVDTVTTNTDMRGTDNAALAATALSTAVWTNTLATNIGTTNTTVATNLDATVSSRMATYTQPTGFLAATFPADVAGLTALASAHGAGSWATATGFSTHTAADVVALLASGTEVFGHSYLESIRRIEVVSGAATLSGAGTGTEVMVSSDASKTATFTVDGSGNISAVVWS